MSTKSTVFQKNIHKVVDKLVGMCYNRLAHKVDYVLMGGDSVVNVVTLRGVVFSKYRTISDFARAIGWKRGKASRIVNGVQDPNIDDMEKIACVLGIDDRDIFMNLFFTRKSTMQIFKK